MVVGGGGDGSIVGDCGLMGIGRGSDSPMVVVEVRCGSWGSLIYWVCVCVIGFGSLIWFCFLWVLVHRFASGSDGGFFFFWIITVNPPEV